MDLKMYVSTFFSVVFIVVFIIALYYGSRWLTKKSSAGIGGRTRHIKIIDKVMLGQDKSIAVADILGGKYIIGISGQQISLLKDLGEIEIPDTGSEEQGDFAAIFGGLLKKQFLETKDRLTGRGSRL